MLKKRARKAGRPSVQPRPTRLVLGDTFRWLKLDESARSFAAMRAYAAASSSGGTAMAANTRAERLRGSILFIRCQTAAWSQHLQILKAELLKQIHKQPGGTEVHDLRCNIGPLDDIPAWERPAPATMAEPPPRHDPPPDVAAALTTVTDDELRHRLSALYRKLGTRPHK